MDLCRRLFANSPSRTDAETGTSVPATAPSVPRTRFGLGHTAPPSGHPSSVILGASAHKFRSCSSQDRRQLSGGDLHGYSSSGDRATQDLPKMTEEGHRYFVRV